MDAVVFNVFFCKGHWCGNREFMDLYGFHGERFAMTSLIVATDSGEVQSVSEEAKAEVSEEAKAKARAMALQAPLN